MWWHRRLVIRLSKVFRCRWSRFSEALIVVWAWALRVFVLVSTVFLLLASVGLVPVGSWWPLVALPVGIVLVLQMMGSKIARKIIRFLQLDRVFPILGIGDQEQLRNAVGLVIDQFEYTLDFYRLLRFLDPEILDQGNARIRFADNYREQLIGSVARGGGKPHDGWAHDVANELAGRVDLEHAPGNFRRGAWERLFKLLHRERTGSLTSIQYGRAKEHDLQLLARVLVESGRLINPPYGSQYRWKEVADLLAAMQLYSLEFLNTELFKLAGLWRLSAEYHLFLARNGVGGPPDLVFKDHDGDGFFDPAVDPPQPGVRVAFQDRDGNFFTISDSAATADGGEAAEKIVVVSDHQGAFVRPASVPVDAEAVLAGVPEEPLRLGVAPPGLARLIEHLKALGQGKLPANVVDLQQWYEHRLEILERVGAETIDTALKTRSELPSAPVGRLARYSSVALAIHFDRVHLDDPMRGDACRRVARDWEAVRIAWAYLNLKYDLRSDEQLGERRYLAIDHLITGWKQKVEERRLKGRETFRAEIDELTACLTRGEWLPHLDDLLERTHREQKSALNRNLTRQLRPEGCEGETGALEHPCLRWWVRTAAVDDKLRNRFARIKLETVERFLDAKMVALLHFVWKGSSSIPPQQR